MNNVSIENPFLNPNGDKLYFSSNLPGSYGGYEPFVSDIHADGALGVPINLVSTINTTEDIKFPSL